MQDIHDQENPSMELQNVTTGNDDPFSGEHKVLDNY